MGIIGAIGYGLVVVVPSVIILHVSGSRRLSAEQRSKALLWAPFLILVTGLLALGMVTPCVDPPDESATVGYLALLVFSGYAGLQLMRRGRGMGRALGSVLFVTFALIAAFFVVRFCLTWLRG